MGYAKFLATFSQTHLVTLIIALFFKKSAIFSPKFGVSITWTQGGQFLTGFRA
jgi:hypothetical protein